MTTLRKLKEKMERDLRREEAEVSLFACIRAVVAKFDGKQNNKRVVTALRAAFPTAQIGQSYGSSLNFYGRSFSPIFTEYGKHFTVYMPRGAQFTLAEFDAANPSQGEPAKGRIEQFRAFLVNDGYMENIASRIDGYHAAEKYLHDLVNDRPWDYTVRRLLKGEQLD